MITSLITLRMPSLTIGIVFCIVIMRNHIKMLYKSTVVIKETLWAIYLQNTDLNKQSLL